MAKARKPAAKISKLPSAKENLNIQLHSSMATMKPFQMHKSSSNGAKVSQMGGTKDAETAALVANLRG